MAERGKPLKFTTREEIKARRPAEPIRKVAEALKVSPNTVRKYEKRV